MLPIPGFKVQTDPGQDAIDVLPNLEGQYLPEKHAPVLPEGHPAILFVQIHLNRAILPGAGFLPGPPVAFPHPFRFFPAFFDHLQMKVVSLIQIDPPPKG